MESWLWKPDFGTLAVESGLRNHGKGIMEEESWDISEASWKHLGGIWEASAGASGEHLGPEVARGSQRGLRRKMC